MGRFAEQLLTCLNLPAADVPCKTAPFASFSGRTEKEGPARPERVPIYGIGLVHFDKTISLFRQAGARCEIFISQRVLCYGFVFETVFYREEVDIPSFVFYNESTNN